MGGRTGSRGLGERRLGLFGPEGFVREWEPCDFSGSSLPYGLGSGLSAIWPGFVTLAPPPPTFRR